MKYGLRIAGQAIVILLFVAGIGFGQSASRQTFAGTLRDISSTELSLRTNNRQMVTVKLAASTKFLRQSNGPIGFADFNPGDQVTVDATQDDAGVYHAVSLTMLQEGTPADRPAVTSSSTSSSGASRSSSPGDDDPDRPRLTRKNAGSDAPQARNTPAPSDPDDPGPPRLAHGTPRNSAPPVEAQNRPSLGAQDVNGVTRPPDPPKVGLPDPEPATTSDAVDDDRSRMPQSGDPVIDKTREAAFAFTDTLPNYVVKQFTTRYATRNASGRGNNWQALDNVSTDVVYENGKESYKNFQINGKASRLSPEETGNWSTGEFAIILQATLSPASDAEFRNKRATTIANKPAWRYDFAIEQPRSGWHVTANRNDSYVPGYTGSIWIDQENYRVLRIEQSARDVPRSFPLDTIESAVDYDYVLIGGQKFLLPVHSENLMCDRGTSNCSRNVIDFRNYRKYTSDSEITFDADPPAK